MAAPAAASDASAGADTEGEGEGEGDGEGDPLHPLVREHQCISTWHGRIVRHSFKKAYSVSGAGVCMPT